MVPEGSAISGSRTTVATTSTITRNCDRPVDEGRRPREEETHHEVGEKSTTEATQRNRDQRQPKRSDATEEESSSQRVRRVQLTKSVRGESDDKKPWC